MTFGFGCFFLLAISVGRLNMYTNIAILIVTLTITRRWNIPTYDDDDDDADDADADADADDDADDDDGFKLHPLNTPTKITFGCRCTKVRGTTGEKNEKTILT